MTGAAERLATTANYSWCLNVVSSACAVEEPDAQFPTHHIIPRDINRKMAFLSDSLPFCDALYLRQEVHLCCDRILLCWSFLQRLSKQSRIHLSLIWLIKPALPLIIFYLFLQGCMMESVREGRRERQPGLVHDNDNVASVLPFSSVMKLCWAENTRLTCPVRGQLPVQG